MEALGLAILRAKEWQQAQAPKPSIRPVQRLSTSYPFTEDSITCYTDASWKADETAGLGWIFKDRCNQILNQGSSPVSNVCSPLMAEALATLAAVGVANESAFKHISFASDSLSLVKALNSKLQSKELHGILHDILSISTNFTCCSFNFIPRDLNRQADALAKAALFFSCTET